MLDLIIKNAVIAAGTGAPGYKADIGVAGGKIACIKQSLDSAAEILDAAGLVAAPGFIDTHTHSDRSVINGSDAYNYLEQGVTTQVAGQCGSSLAPFYSGGGPSDDINPEELERARAICDTPSSFMKYASATAFGTNMGFLLSHGALRRRVMGYSYAKPTGQQMSSMKDILTEAMESGFLGYSSGLGYAPSAYADTQELIALARVIAPYGGCYTSHIRGEGDTVEESVAEAIRVGEEGGTSVIISHLKVCGKRNEGKSQKLLRMIEAANMRVVKVRADQYPFCAGSAPLADQIPPKFHVGGMDALLDRLRNPDTRKLMLDAINNRADAFESCIYGAGFDGTMVVESPKNPSYIGKNIAQIANEQGKSPMDAFCDILIENAGMGQGIYFSQNESDMLRIIAHPYVVGGSDWSDFTRRHDPEKAGGCHPRATSTFVRRLMILSNRKLLSMEAAIKGVTSSAAEALNLKDHGLLKEGFPANITILNYNQLKANADYLHPYRRNEGIEYVIVNGQIAVRNGTATGIKAGKVIKR
ncbi:MAG: amidohydrolase family protein [Clostridiales bacterium]|jgi:N-acyl-D-amino-acid deacylase|nr:amidohydrolase family protein [Clostridiales bacterium]